MDIENVRLLGLGTLNHVPVQKGVLQENSNVVNTPQEPIVFNQDPGEDSSQSPLQIDHQCCYGCGDLLDGVFCRRCTFESYGKGAHICYNCPPKVSVVSNLKPCHNQNDDELPQTLTSFHPTCYSGDENSFVLDSTPNFDNDSPNVFHPPSQTSTNSYEFCGNDAHYSTIVHLNHDDDDENYTNAVTPEEPDNSLSMGDEHLDIIPKMESDEVIKSSVEDLVPIPSESEGILDNTCDVPFHDNSSPLDVFEDQFEEFSDFNDDSTLIDDDYFSIENIDYIELSPPDSELVSLEETFNNHTEETNSDSTTTHANYSLPKYDLFLFEIEPDQSKLTSVVILAEPRVHVLNVLTTHPTLMLDSDFILSDNSLPESKIFYFDNKKKNSGRTTIHADISLSDLECFNFKPDPGELTSIVDFEIRENILSATNVNLPPEDDHSPLFAYVVWIFLSFFTYHVVPPNLLSFGNEDTIFDPDISNYHFSSFLPDVSHRCETFMKFNVYPNHLNESPMKILSLLQESS
nr:hypothetical protein [Tanacetum cinerariifolium]